MTAVEPPAVCKADQPCLPFPLTSIYSLLRNSGTYCGNGVEGGERREEIPKSEPNSGELVSLGSFAVDGEKGIFFLCGPLKA